MEIVRIVAIGVICWFYLWMTGLIVIGIIMSVKQWREYGRN